LNDGLDEVLPWGEKENDRFTRWIIKSGIIKRRKGGNYYYQNYHTPIFKILHSFFAYPATKI
jgi:hypothetical protein